jgi:HK97 family phage portal protein
MNLWKRAQAAYRAFVLGPGVVEQADIAWGHDDSQFSPPEYGDYIATSNGVYACASLRADLLSSVSLKLYKQRRGASVEITAGLLYDLLHRVNPYWTLNRLVQMMELSLCLWGEVFLFLERGPTTKGMPKEIWWGRPDRVSIIPDVNNYIAGYLYDPANGEDPIPFRPWEVIWLRYPNPLDEFSGLSPLAAARVAADYATDAMRSNRNLFANGLQMAGALFPKANQKLSPEAARELEMVLDRRFKGVDKAHRWGVFRFEADVKEFGISPKDAEFLGGMQWALEDICRAYKVPLDLVGGQRTYENVGAAERAVWIRCIAPEARFIGMELTEHLLPMFPGQADVAEFDLSDVEALQEAEGERWTRAKEEIAAGTLLINEWRDEQGREPVPWGSVWWASSSLTPISSAEKPKPEPLPISPALVDAKAEPPALPAPEDEGAEEDGEMPSPARTLRRRAIEYGSPEHEFLCQRWNRRAESKERRFGAVVADLMRRQRDSVLSRLRQPKRDIESAAAEPFDLAEWTKRFRQEVRAVLRDIIGEAGTEALEDLGLALPFDLSSAEVVRFLEGRAQRFAKTVNETTWRQLKNDLGEGIEKGESVDELAARVERVMDSRIRSSAETIARTEVLGAASGGTLQAWRQSGVVVGKRWVATLDSRARDDHRDAHGQAVKLDADFKVGNSRGPAPGQMDSAEGSVNCRCTMIAVLE